MPILVVLKFTYSQTRVDNIEGDDQRKKGRRTEQHDRSYSILADKKCESGERALNWQDQARQRASYRVASS